MSRNQDNAGVEQPENEAGQDQDAPGVELGRTDGEGSTFEPEEDPEGHAG